MHDSDRNWNAPTTPDDASIEAGLGGSGLGESGVGESGLGESVLDGRDLDRLLERARQICDAPVASIRLLDGGARVLSGAGATVSPAARETTFCRSAIDSGRPLVVQDASGDARFRDDRLVTGPAGIRFYAGAPLVLAPGCAIGTLCLLDAKPRRLSAEETAALVEALTDLAETVALRIARRRDAITIARLRAEAETEAQAQALVIGEQAVSLAHSRKIFDRASEVARIGVWECALPDETLTWTDGVYDMFDMPRGAAIDRQRTLACYTEESRQALEAARSRAIAERGGFHLDVEIVTPAGRRRWIRLTATVESEGGKAARIFGMKQDITEEKVLYDRTRYLAEFDVMTGLANRSQFQARLPSRGEACADRMAIGALLLVDLDGFKQINDTFGHAAGDECLREAAQRLGATCREADLVARIGGDEFAILLDGCHELHAVEALAGRIVDAMGRPVEHAGRSMRLGASVGVALAEPGAPSDLFTRADSALYAAKAAGRNTFRTFDAGMEQAAA